MMWEPTVVNIEKRRQSLESARNSWIGEWREIRDNLMPDLGVFTLSPQQQGRGERTDSNILDSTGTMAAHYLAAGLMAGLSPANRPWFKLLPRDPDLATHAPVRRYLDDAEAAMYQVFGHSNFYNCAHHVYLELGTFNTAAQSILSDPMDAIITKTYTIGEYALGQNQAGRVNEWCRAYIMTADQMVDAFGMDELPPSVQADVRDSARGQNQHIVVHYVGPNPGTDPEKMDAASMPYVSLFYLDGKHENKFLRRGGFRQFPFQTPRWFVKPNDVWGVGPGRWALPDVKMLQRQTEDMLVGAAKLVDPPTIATTDILANGGVNSVPGGVTVVNQMAPGSAGQGARSLYDNYRPDLSALSSLVINTQNMIRERFFANLFASILMGSDTQKTAREIIERSNEKMTLIGPVVDRLQSEYLKPTVERTFSIIQEMGMLPDAPEELEGQELTISYKSILAQAQQMVGLTQMEQGFLFLGNLAKVKPEVLDKLDGDKLADSYWGALGAPSDCLHDENEVLEIRTERAKKEQLQEAAAYAQQGAQTAQTLGQTPAGGNNALSALMGAMGQVAGR